MARSYGHIAERSPGNIGGVFIGRGNHAGIYHASSGDQPDGPTHNLWADDPFPGESNEPSALLSQATGQASNAALRSQGGQPPLANNQYNTNTVGQHRASGWLHPRRSLQLWHRF